MQIDNENNTGKNVLNVWVDPKRKTDYRKNEFPINTCKDNLNWNVTIKITLNNLTTYNA